MRSPSSGLEVVPQPMALIDRNGEGKGKEELLTRQIDLDMIICDLLVKPIKDVARNLGPFLLPVSSLTLSRKNQRGVERTHDDHVHMLLAPDQRAEVC